MCYGMGCQYESSSGECTWHGGLPFPCPTRSILNDFDDDGVPALDACETPSQAKDWLKRNDFFFIKGSPLKFEWRDNIELVILYNDKPYTTFIFGDE